MGALLPSRFPIVDRHYPEPGPGQLGRLRRPALLVEPASGGQNDPALTPAVEVGLDQGSV